MNNREFADNLIKRALQSGFSEAEVYYSGGSQFEVMIYESQVNHFENSRHHGISFRGIFNGNMGYAYTERFHEDDIEFLLNEAKQNAEIIAEDEKEIIYGGDENYPLVNCFNPQLAEVKVAQKISKALEMEKAAKEADGKISALEYCMIGSGESRVMLTNSKGLSLSFEENMAMAYVSAVAKDKDDIKTGFDYWFGNEFDAFDPQKTGRKAAAEAISHLGAKPVATKNYTVVLSNNVAASLLNTYARVFFAESVQKGFSLLKDKLNQNIASPSITIRDDALLENMPGSASFDSEGVATSNKIIVEKGCLKTYLYNLKSAARDGVKSTGNGFKPGFKAPVDTAPTNFYILPSEDSLATIMKPIKDGLYITDVAGLHAGTNTVSGDFSLSAEGFRVEDGKITTPVEQITISGNFYSLLESVDAVADDLKFNMSGGIGSPALRVRSVSVSGN